MGHSGPPKLILDPKRRTRAAIVAWLNQWTFTHFITLATNDPGLSVEQARRLVREWDARTNRALFGPKWRWKPDERLFGFYFLEKPASNPHWHGLIKLDHFDPELRAEHARLLLIKSELVWQKLKPSGSVDVKAVDNNIGVCKYVAKELGNEVSYSEFVLWNEF